MRISDGSSDVCSSDLDQWARTVGMSRRALTRNFRLQTGLSLAVWRQQARLEAASARLRMGEPVTRVAYEVGYESVATFSMIFRQNFGTTPDRKSTRLNSSH